MSPLKNIFSLSNLEGNIWNDPRERYYYFHRDLMILLEQYCY